MLDSAKKMYQYFLTEVRKERTVVITPDQWSDMINPIALDWVKTKLPELEFNQKRIDDLEALKVLTDFYTYGIDRLPAVHIANGLSRFWIPYQHTIYGVRFPKYLHGISAQFLNKYDDDRDALFGKILRSDVRGTVKRNPYRQRNKTWIYFEERGGNIFIEEPRRQNLTERLDRLILEYYKYPDKIKYDPKHPNEFYPGSFRPTQNKEIMDMAVTRYLERVSDQRIQTQPSVSAQVPK